MSSPAALPSPSKIQETPAPVTQTDAPKTTTTPRAETTPSASPKISPTPQPTPTGDGREWLDIDESGISEEGYVQGQETSAVDKKSICKKFEGKYISHYDKVYRVKACSAFEMSDQDELYELMQKKSVTPIVVDAETMRALVKKTVPNGLGKKSRTCKELEKKYVTLDGLDIYYIESCKKRLFLDYQSFNEHREKASERSAAHRIVEKIDYKEFKSLKLGEDMTSVLNKEYAQYLRSRGQKEIEIISVEEACTGLEGKIVSYTDRLYKIEKCHKVQLDASEFTRKNPDRTYVEISSEVWISLPDALPKATPQPKMQDGPGK